MQARMVRVYAVAAVLAAGLAGSLFAGEAAPAFTKKPQATRAGDRVRIEFAVNRATDVAVAVEDAAGNVVRHLVAGALGANPPPPLKPNSLEQSVEWDGKADYDKAAGAGPFKVRVSLGLRGEFDRVLIGEPQALAGVNCIAVGPDGTVYVMMGAGGTGPVWSGQIMAAFDRAGKFVRQVMPFPGDLEQKDVAGFDAVEVDGRPAPVVHEIQGRSFYSAMTPRKAGMAVTKDDVVLTMLGGCSVGAVGGHGAAPWGRYAGPRVFPKSGRSQFGARPFIAVSSDGKFAYLAGLMDGRLDERQNLKLSPLSAVYRVPLPARGPAEPFFGDPAATGADETHLGGMPRGIAPDGKGNLLIADAANNRIVAVSEADGKFVSSFAVEAGAGAAAPMNPKKPRASDKDSGPDCVAADANTGAVYVTRLAGGGSIELIKYDGLKSGKAVARLPLQNSGNPDFPWLLAFDAGAKPPIVWLGSDGGQLLRIEDLGAKFSAPAPVGSGRIGNGSFVDLSVDRVRSEIYTRCWMGEGSYSWFRYNERTGDLGKVTLSPIPSAAGSQMVPGPDGTLYCPAYPYHLLRFTHEGKPIPWNIYPTEVVGKDGKSGGVRPVPHGSYVPVSMTFLTHTLGIRRDGHLFMFEPSHPGDRPPKMLVEYDADGKRIGEPIIWKVSDSAVGPKFDPQGNIYIAEQVKPADEPCPPEFASLVGKVQLNQSYLEGLKDSVCSMYGSIVKFSPKGGMVHLGGENPFKGEPRLDPSLKTTDVASYHGHRLYPTKVTGALWIRTGISHVDEIACNCENTRFDVDEFGRVFYPDLGRFHVAVLDTNGNAITRFGRYGNANDTEHLAFSWLIGVAATDRYAYMGDSLNRRLLRAKLVYAAEEICDLPK